MSNHRVLTLGLVALAFVGVLSLTGQERPRKDDRDKVDRADAPDTATYAGRIARVDADKRTISLKELRRVTPRPAVGTDKGTPPSEMTFRVAEKAKVTLDGGDVALSDLKAGAFARVHVRRDPVPAGEKDRATTAKDRESKVGGPAVMLAVRIDAFSKEPTSPKGTAGEKDKDR